MTQTDLLVFARAAGLAARAPGFSHPSVPVAVRVGFALALAGAVAPSVGVTPERALPLFVLAAAAEFCLGAAIGFGAALLYDAAYFAGRTIDDYVGIHASVPTAGVTASQAFGRLWSSVFLAAFMLLDGWRPVVGVFADSFAHVAPGALPRGADWLHYGLALPTTVLRAAAVVAAPAIAVAAALQLTLAAVARVVPRFAGFSLSFPVVFAGVLLVTVIAVPLLAPLGARPWFVVPWSAP